MIVSNLFVRTPNDGEPSLPKFSVPSVEIYSGGCRGDFNSFRFNNYKNVCEKKGKQYDPENRAGSAVLQLTYQATPCKKLAQLSYVGEEKVAEFIKTMRNRRGWYAKVVQEGAIKQGDEFILL